MSNNYGNWVAKRTSWARITNTIETLRWEMEELDKIIQIKLFPVLGEICAIDRTSKEVYSYEAMFTSIKGTLEKSLAINVQLAKSLKMIKQHVECDSSMIDVTKEKLKKNTKALCDAKQAVEDAEKERLILLLNIQLTKIEELPVEKINQEDMNNLKKQLAELPADNEKVKEILDKLYKLKQKKKDFNEKLKQLHNTIEQLQTITDSIDKQLHPDAASAGKKKKKKKKKKGKKPKREKPVLSIAELQSAVGQLVEQVLPALDEIAFGSIDAPTEKNTAAGIKNKATQLVKEIQKDLEDKIAKEEQIAKVDAKLNELQQTTVSVLPLASTDVTLIENVGDLKTKNDQVEAEIAALVDRIKDINETAAGNVTPEQKNALENAKVEAESYLDKLKRLRDALFEKLSNFRKCDENRKAIALTMFQPKVNMFMIFVKCDSQDDLKFADDTRRKMVKLSDNLEETKKCLHDNLPTRENDLDAHINKLKRKREKLDQLLNKSASDQNIMLPLLPNICGCMKINK